MWISVFCCVDEGGGFEKGDHHAASHYTELSVNAHVCLNCGHCGPYGVRQEQRLEEISRYFSVQ